MGTQSQPHQRSIARGLIQADKGGLSDLEWLEERIWVALITWKGYLECWVTSSELIDT